ncbi:MAG: SHOCT domain-containing protein [Oscillospiraceae bacterium]|nr:SHOCT domain-containing protein [Oscillospiraceae bacterium]
MPEPQAHDASAGEMAKSFPAGESHLIRTYIIPDNVRKQYAKYLSLELYTDRLVGKGGPNGDITYFFKNYMRIQWTPANLGTQFAQLVFITPENASRYITGSNLNDMVDTNKIPFCSGMFSYQEANTYCKSVYLDIKAVMDVFKERESTMSSGGQTIVQQKPSGADEIRKYKALMDEGIITPEEFEAKKKSILGL